MTHQLLRPLLCAILVALTASAAGTDDSIAASLASEDARPTFTRQSYPGDEPDCGPTPFITDLTAADPAPPDLTLPATSIDHRLVERPENIPAWGLP